MKGIWAPGIIDDYFHEERKKVMQGSNPLEHMLSSDHIKKDPELYVPYEVFWNAFRAHCQANNFGTQKKTAFTEDFYGIPFERHGLKVTAVRVRKTYRSDSRYVRYILGCDLAEQNENQQASDQPQAMILG